MDSYYSAHTPQFYYWIFYRFFETIRNPPPPTGIIGLSEQLANHRDMLWKSHMNTNRSVCLGVRACGCAMGAHGVEDANSYVLCVSCARLC